MNQHISWYKRISLIAAGALLLLSVSCTKNFEDYNRDPSKATDSLLQYDYIGKAIFITQMEKSVFPNATTGDASVYQVGQNLCADVFSGFLAFPTPFGGSRNNATYALNDGWTRAYFNNELNNVLSGWLEIKRRDSISNPEIFAVAQIIKVLSMQRVTDLYGPMPYSAYGGGGFSVAYDSQETIYRSFFTDLDKAIASLDKYTKANPGAKPIEKYDLVYSGDFIKWMRLANSIKLRAAMRLSYVLPDLARQKAEEAVADAHGLLTDNNDNALLQTQGGITIVNPLYVISETYGADTRMSANMESFLTGFHDPRIAAYFNTSTEFPGVYKGIRAGIDIVAKDDRKNFSGLHVTVSTPIQWMTAAEVYFLRAEGALRNWNMNGTAKALYEQGIQVSFAKENVPGVATYLADNTSTAAPYTDPVDSKNNVAPGAPELSTITIRWEDGDSFEKNLERIITQKWIAIYPEGGEGWSELRRTGYPKTFPIVVNYSNGVISTQTRVRRLPFPLPEYNTNALEVQKAVGLLGGPDNGSTRLWWDKKP
ncbi:RagB/SusD family nutrient uptake outer membrane protein [Chitinophaga sp. Cy-1792]|uniref:RagB/SusD family nutrient uptake outer membrane protein n=1 Tax=Chitinophaga sp. Cy-1792 TaxID=2608339 RepID=UPI00141E1955|nr:RagB/SusD family nutrient uptake outer membrane protein [Chitinophaga sp. Cy-1792]NIG56789.1 SusD/RagB family nutrient-binding outer membrane lipoprotein [Chitinophaga sp. Cy-1792]